MALSRVQDHGSAGAKTARLHVKLTVTHVRSWIAVRVMNANLATLIETPGVLDAGAFAIVFCGAETLLVCVDRPHEDQNDQTHNHSCEDPHVLNGSSHVLTPRW
jgi:hypothetical protein